MALIIQVIAMLAVPALFGEHRDRRVDLTATALLTAARFFGFAFAPATGTWAWLILIGIGHGGLFPLVLALPVSASRDPAHASRLPGMAFYLGYGAAAVAVLVVGPTAPPGTHQHDPTPQPAPTSD